MILIDEAKFEKYLKTTSENVYIEDPVWNNIARYRIALRWNASTEAANDAKSNKSNKLITSFIDQFYDLNVCTKKIIDELFLEIPPNMQKICNALERESNAASNTKKNIETEVSQLKSDVAQDSRTLYYQKLIGDLYSLMSAKSIDEKFDRQIYEKSFREAVEENGGFIDFSLKIYKYLFKIKQDKMPTITITHASKIREVLQATEVEKERLDKMIFMAESDWYQMVCSG